MTTTSIASRAIFIDVDGTLLHDGCYIPDSAIEAIRTARAHGHLVFLSTGRAMPELRGQVLDVGFDGVVSNGGAFASIGDELIVSQVMPQDVIIELEAIFAARGLHWYLQSYDDLFPSPGLPELMQDYRRRDEELHLEKAAKAGVAPEDLDFFTIAVKEFSDPALVDRSGIAKAVLLNDDADAMDRLLADLAPKYAVVSGTIPVPFGASGEVTMQGINKGAAILATLDRLGIAPEQAIGIGDNWNDVEMFEVCGTSIAMGNAHPDVQALTDQVTASLLDDGIYRAFESNGLLSAR
ncbi:MAG: Cof-type HAD-IIB family hydrolase [Ancrocorticia sp.]